MTDCHLPPTHDTIVFNKNCLPISLYCVYVLLHAGFTGYCHQMRATIFITWTGIHVYLTLMEDDTYLYKMEVF